MIILIFLLLSLVALIIATKQLNDVLVSAPRLQNLVTSFQANELAASSPAQNSELWADLPKISVIIPAYNEAENIQACVTSILTSTTLPADKLEVWVVDDQSTDETFEIASTLQQQQADPRLKILPGRPRPTDEVWVGKNWACAQVALLADGEFLLFLDADVRLKPGAIETAVTVAEQTQAALLTGWINLVCGCFGEWLAQPLMYNVLLLGFDFNQVNDPASETVFAVGPFMCFRRSAYDKIGGHRAVAREVVEDVELGRRIKQAGLKLHYVLAPDVAEVRMYRSWAALWEGWTKNWYVGCHRNLSIMAYLIVSILVMYTFPWVGLILLVVKGWLYGATALSSLLLVVTLIAIGLHYNLRRLSAKISGMSTRYWWLTGFGGIAVAAIALASIIKTETGWGWTWRGRSLRVPKSV